MAQRILGEELWGLKVAVKGPPLDVAGAVRLARKNIRLIGMNYQDPKTGQELSPQVWRYPWLGKGGEGETLCQPAFTLCQPLFESFSWLIPGMVGVDTWAEHGGWYLVIESCKWFSPRRVVRHLKRMGWQVVDWSASHVSLKPREPWRRRLWRWLCG